MKKFLTSAGAASVLAFLAAGTAANATLTTFGSTGSVVPVYFLGDGFGGGVLNTGPSDVQVTEATTFQFQTGPFSGVAVPVTITLVADAQSTTISTETMNTGYANYYVAKSTFTYGGKTYHNGSYVPVGAYNANPTKVTAHLNVKEANVPSAAYNSGNVYQLTTSVSTAQVAISFSDFAITSTNTTPILETVNGVKYEIKPGADILSGTNLYGSLTGTAGKVGATLTLDAKFDPAVSKGDFSSTLFNFNPNGDAIAEQSVSFTDSQTTFGISNGMVTTTSFEFNGNFSSDPVPVTNPIPEPATWAMMLVGFGAVGGALRRRNAIVAA